MKRCSAALRSAFAVVLLLALVAGCSFGAKPSESANIGYAVGPVKLSVGFDGVTVSLGHTWATFAGTFSVDTGIKWAKDRKNTDKLAVVVKHTVNGERIATVYEIEGGDKLRVLIEGRTIQEFSRNSVEIDAAPGAIIEINPEEGTAAPLDSARPSAASPTPTASTSAPAATTSAPAATTPAPEPSAPPKDLPLPSPSPSAEDLPLPPAAPSPKPSTRPTSAAPPPPPPSSAKPSARTTLPSGVTGFWQGRVFGTSSPGDTLFISLSLYGGSVDRVVGGGATSSTVSLCQANVVLIATKTHPVDASNVLLRMEPINCPGMAWVDLTLKGNTAEVKTYLSVADADQHKNARYSGTLTH